MKTVLDQPRDITIGGVTRQFRDHAYLADRIEIEVEVIQRADAELDDNPGEASQIWAYIATHAAYLEELLAAQEQWLAEHDAIVAQETADVRAAIRNLPSPSYKGDEEGGS